MQSSGVRAMSIPILKTTALLLSVILASNERRLTETYSMNVRSSQTNQYHSPFRYIVIANEVTKPDGDVTNSTRTVSVLLDERAFSEGNLKNLFALLSKRFAAPKRLDVWLYTSLEQIETP